MANLNVNPPPPPSVKGRAMLHWVGKSAPKEVSYFPAQLAETFCADPPPEPTWATLERNWSNLLFHGDNKEVLSSLLVNGFRGKIDLIYIDPPFDSGANYVRKVSLRGRKDALAGEGLSIGEERQYEDIWANDTYLQYMYERLILMRELLSEQGSLYLHCDWHKSHHLRFLMDEVFGQDNFLNEIVWHYPDNFQGNVKRYAINHNNIFIYRKGSNCIFRRQKIKLDKPKRRPTRVWDAKEKRLKVSRDENGSIVYNDYDEQYVDDVWQIAQRKVVVNTSIEHTGYPTQKPEKLLERIIRTSSEEGSIVLDCFCGSGTTAAVAERFGRRWIMADMNRGAIQTTAKRLQCLRNEHQQERDRKLYGFATYKVNNYDFKDQNQLREVIVSKYGIEQSRSDSFFDGTREGALVKIAELNRPLSPHDIQAVDKELSYRPDETRNIVVIGNGVESKTHEEVQAHEKTGAINKIKIIDAQKDRLVVFRAAEVKVDFARRDGHVQIRIEDYISPAILGRLEIDRTVFDEQIDDFRAQIDCVVIDADYDGAVFRISEQDMPEKKQDLIKSVYEIKLPHPKARVAVKIIDVLGEEVLTVEES